MKQFIKHAYAHSEAMDFFNSITKEDVLKLYKELDYVYDLLESLDVVSFYSGNELLKEFSVDKALMGDDIYISVGDKFRLLDVNLVINGIVGLFTKVS